MFFSPSSLCGGDDADGCATEPPSLPLPIAAIPFLATGCFVATLSSRHLFPHLGAPSSLSEDPLLPTTTTTTSWTPRNGATTATTLPRVAFAALLALATMLAEVILFDMAGLVGPRTREAVLGVVVPGMIALLVLGVPVLELRGLVAGWKADQGKKTKRAANVVLAGLFAGWLFTFWIIGGVAPATQNTSDDDSEVPSGVVDSLVRASLTRVGIIGITLMALLSGFASVSTPWHLIIWPMFSSSSTTAPSESDILSKQTNLDTTSDMLLAKRQRLQTLERKASSTSATSPLLAARGGPGGFMGKMMGTIRAVASSDDMERRALRVEIAALETVEATLATKLTSLRARYEERLRAATPLGRMLALPTHIFAVYCLYRVCATAVSTLRRHMPLLPASSPSAFSSTDPVSRVVALAAWHWDPTLDPASWARQISFLLSGAILCASLSSAMQTVQLFSRAVPGFLVRHARSSAPLLASQVAATYVVAAALLLRGSLPQEVVQGGAVGGVLRGVLEPEWVETWFDGWFLIAGALTAAGIWVGRKLDVRDEEDDDEKVA